MKTKMNVNDFHDKVLLIEGDPADAKVIQAALADVRYGPFDVESVRQLSDAYERLGKEGIGAVLVDLFRARLSPEGSTHQPFVVAGSA